VGRVEVGIRIFARGVLPATGRKKDSIEIYDRQRFFTVTGNHIAGTPRTVESRQQAIGHLHRQVFGKQIEQPPFLPALASSDLSRSGDAEVLTQLQKAKNSAKFCRLFSVGDIRGYVSHSEADLALCGLIAHYTSDPHQIDRLFRQSRLLRAKWDEQRGDKTYGLLTIETAIEGSFRWRLETLKVHLWSLPLFSGKAGPSRLLILLYFFDLAQNIGHVTVEASIIDIADAVGLVKQTVIGALRWLQEHSFLKKHSRRHKRATWANSYTLSLAAPALEQQGAECSPYIHISLPPVYTYGGSSAPSAFFSHDAFRHRGLSKNAARFLAVLAAGPVRTLEEIMKRTGLRERTTKTWSKKLRELGLIVKTDEGWQLGPNTLDAAAEMLGTTEKAKRQQAEHDHQRALYREYLGSRGCQSNTENPLKVVPSDRRGSDESMKNYA
jgi:hypothetical protein